MGVVDGDRCRDAGFRELRRPYASGEAVVLRTTLVGDLLTPRGGVSSPPPRRPGRPSSSNPSRAGPPRALLPLKPRSGPGLRCRDGRAYIDRTAFRARRFCRTRGLPGEPCALTPKAAPARRRPPRWPGLSAISAMSGALMERLAPPNPDALEFRRDPDPDDRVWCSTGARRDLPRHPLRRRRGRGGRLRERSRAIESVASPSSALFRSRTARIDAGIRAAVPTRPPRVSRDVGAPRLHPAGTSSGGPVAALESPFPLPACAPTGRSGGHPAPFLCYLDSRTSRRLLSPESPVRSGMRGHDPADRRNPPARRTPAEDRAHAESLLADPRSGPAPHALALGRKSRPGLR